MGSFMFGFGIFLILCSILDYQKQKMFLKTAIQTQGVVVSFKKKKASEEDLKCSSMVEFTALDEKKFEFDAAWYSDAMPYQVGTKLDVLYDPSKPEAAQIKDFSYLWVDTLMLCSFAIIFLLIGSQL